MRSLSKGSPRSTQDCNCLALRQAARYVTQHYDHYLAPMGLRPTQFSILARLQRKGPMTINVLATELVMDRTTLGRNILPLQRDGLIEVAIAGSDRRRKELRVTSAGAERLTAAAEAWTQAQASFETAFGQNRSAELRGLLRAVVATGLPGNS
jgi:DNA-binding MarR family transcriptional regulator